MQVQYYPAGRFNVLAPYTLKSGSAPLLVSMPHSGTIIPGYIAERLLDEALTLPDTDWHLNELYGFLDELEVSVLTANMSRLVIDLNRGSEGQPLYPGMPETGLCSTILFSGSPVYRAGKKPDASEISRRIKQYWHPYHVALSQELARLKARHGFAILIDAHSIRSRVPALFDGLLPDFNIGTNAGRSCASGLSAAVMNSIEATETYSSVLDGRFKGGFITRHYGRPEENIHAFQIELSQRTYMDEDNPALPLKPENSKVVDALKNLVLTVVEYRP